MDTLLQSSAASTGITLADRAYLVVRERIFRGDLPAGAPLSRRRVAAELGMSLLPVSEALQRLEADGLLESRPRAGTRVRVPDEQDIRDRFEVREALESQVARLFATRATASDRQTVLRMAEHVDAMFQRLASGGEDTQLPHAVLRVHNQFHTRIAEAANCPALSELLDKTQVPALNWGHDVSLRRCALPRRFHSELAETLAAGDPAAADLAMRAHIRYALDDRIGHLETSRVREWRERRNARAS